MDYYKKALEMHKKHKGKLEVISKIPLNTMDDLSIAYTPGMAEPCRKIAQDKKEVFNLTLKANTVAVVSDGSAVLGLGNIGAEAAIPVMEGKALLFKEFGGVDAFPICVTTQDVEEIIETVKRIAPVFGGINLEDISAPRCFEIERRLQEELDIPVFHDDQHGTAIVALAALYNSLKLAGKEFSQVKVAMMGAGAAGIATAKLLLHIGIQDIIMCDSKGLIYEGRDRLNSAKEEMAKVTNKEKMQGTLSDAMKGADVFIGTSVGNLVTQDMVRSMSEKAIVIAMANPTPEIMPPLAKEAGALIAASGRSDFPNQVNNVLAFPGIFRGLLDARIKKVTDEIKIVAAKALASCVENPTPEMILPLALDKSVGKKIAQAVMECKK